jgi:hypothetical protein
MLYGQVVFLGFGTYRTVFGTHWGRATKLETQLTTKIIFNVFEI